MKISFITTIYNEEKTIEKFLDSLFVQTKLPDEIIIVDGGSTDKTVQVIKSSSLQVFKSEKWKKVKFKLLVKNGNRSIGRNEAIKNATGDIIVCSDAGNVLDKKWLEKITRPFVDPSSHKATKGLSVVAGYYQGLANPSSHKATKGQSNIFQKCLIPYVLVMPDKVDPDTFLPATRSIAFTKKIWKRVGGFDETLSHNEDYAFANKLKEVGAKIVFAKDAIVNWIPRNSYKEAFVMFFRFALGDAEAGIWRTNVLLLFARYFLGLYFIFLSLLYKSFAPLFIIAGGFVIYLIWSVKKNYRYVNDKRAFIILPLLQFTADAAVLSGTLIGALKRITRFNYFLYLKKNKFLFLILSVYIIIELLTLRWGIPNENHPFPYHMDEWHQLQAVANTFRYGTPNTAGSANGTMFHFLFSGFYIIPFMLLKIINPFALQIDNWVMRERVFEVLRVQTILFGLLSIFTLYKISDVINASKKLTIFLFTFTPIWLMLSGYFKYDIALMFWIVLSLFFFFRFAKKPTNRNFILAAIPSSLAIAVKVSAGPLFILYIFSYFWFHPFWRKNMKTLFIGIGIFLLSLLLFGFPDTLFGTGNILYYLYNNIIESREVTANINVGVNAYAYLFFVHYPLMFGYGLIILFVLSLLLFVRQFLKASVRSAINNYRIELFLFVGLGLFIGSLVSITISSAGNRTLVLLPFFVLIIALLSKKLGEKKKKIPLLFIVVMVILQVVITLNWMSMKIMKSPQEAASEWMMQHIIAGDTIGIENIPLYQGTPDIVQKEFYLKQYKKDEKNRYTYEIIHSKSKKLPTYVIITNGEIETKLLKVSPKKELIKRLKQENYKEIATFSPYLRFYTIWGTDVDYYLSNIVPAPLTTSIYKK